METIETVNHFLHQLSAIVWLGGLLALNVVQLLLRTDRAGLAPLLRLSDLYGRAVIAPAGIITLLTGIVLVAQMDDVEWTDLWVIWGFAGIALSLGIGATAIRVNNAELRRIAGDGAGDEVQLSDRQRRAAILYGVNLVVLLSTVWAMVFKPTV